MQRKVQQTQLPKGAKIYLPDEAAQKRRVEAELWSVFRKWGYREIVTPAYEYFDVLSQGTDQELQERMFKMVDRESGRLLALRADVTPQIARIVATRMREEPKPLRLHYVTNVFRYDEAHGGRYRECYQAGVELIGLPNPEGDAEMIAMTVEGLRALGLERFQIDVGQADFFRGILEDLAVDPAAARELRRALGRKDLPALGRPVRGARAGRAPGQERALGGGPGEPGRGLPPPAGLRSSRLGPPGPGRSPRLRLLFGRTLRGLCDRPGGAPRGGRALRPDAGPLRLRLPGHRLRLRERTGAPGHGVAGRGAPAGRTRFLRDRLHRGQEPPARDLAAAAGRGGGGGARHHQPPARGVAGLRAGTARGLGAGHRGGRHGSRPRRGRGPADRRGHAGGADGAARGSARGPASAFSGNRRWSCLTSWWSGRSGVTRGRARSWTCWPPTWAWSCATRAATTRATRWWWARRSSCCSPSPPASCTAGSAA